MKTQFLKSRRLGFTLIELLVVMTVIGILVGMLAFGVMPAINRAREAAIQVEMKQIELSIENFKNDYGFYPPSFVRITNAGANTDAQSIATLLRYINQISPNHQEATGIPGSRPIDVWWDEVGRDIGYSDGDDLVFWLSGLFLNKQFPLTNNAAVGNMPAAYDDGQGNRHTLYEFKQGRLEIHNKVAHYPQRDGDATPFLYIDAASYETDPMMQFTGYNTFYDTTTMQRTFINPKTFQLVTLGLDQLSDVFDMSNDFGNVFKVPVASQDNIVNFADGRLDAYVNARSD